MDRREFLKFISVASGASVLAGCNLDRNTEKLIPYLVPPDDGVIPGEAVFKSTTCTECPASCGLSVRIREGRPVKLEGLANHPVNEGGLCVRGQASLGRLYNDARIRGPLVKGAPATWDSAYKTIVDRLGENKNHVYLSGRTTGSLDALTGQFCERMGVTRRPEIELFSYGAIREANRALFGRAVVPTYRIDLADFFLSFGADVLNTFVSPVEHTKQLAKARRKGHFDWVHVEPHASVGGMRAENRLVVKVGSEAHVLSYLLGAVRKRRIFTERRVEEHLNEVPEVGVAEAASVSGVPAERLESLAESLLSAQHPLVLAGGVSTANDNGFEVARLCGLLQAGLGMIGRTVQFSFGEDYSRVGSMADVQSFVEMLDSGDMGVVFIAQTDAVAQLPIAFELAGKLGKADLVVGIGDTMTETMKMCDVVLPVSHSLESWGDRVPRDGLVSAIQPMIEPLFDTRSDGDILIGLMEAAGKTPPADDYQSYVLARWRRSYGAKKTQQLLDEGFAETAVRGARVVLRASRQSYRFASPPQSPVLAVVPSLRFYDGRSRSIALLNEIPDPLTSVTWDRWVSVSFPDAKRLGLENGDWVSLAVGRWNVELPVRLQPGLPADVFMIETSGAAMPVGWNETTGECDAVVGGLSVRKTAKEGRLTALAGAMRVETKGHIPMEHSPHHGYADSKLTRDDVTFYPVPNYPEYRWAMAIDLDLCSGCSGCVAACYIENNVPVVGRDEHLKGRELSWIRIEPYYDENNHLDTLPMMCQQCDAAPCEPVCPVFATYHNNEGLNAQVYNRCVGTRYCSNNCPYKVRRFNWFNYSKRPEPVNLMVNPDVSLRGKGIMEKCSFCVQRIRKARDVAKDEGRPIRDGEAIPACAQSCPSDAITFGNLKDPTSKVARWARDADAHHALDELGTGPAVYYLKRGVNDDEHHG